MKKYLISIGLILTIALLSSCSAKKYDLSSKPTVVFKTTMGDVKIGFYKKAAPKSVELFLKLCKEKRYSNTLIDEILNLPPSNFLISMGGTVKWEAIDDAARKELELEIVQKDKKIEKGELLYSAKNEVFGFFSINTNSTAIERNEEDVKTDPIIIFGKVIDGDKVLSDMMSLRVDSNFIPLEEVKILDVEVVE